MASLYLNEDLHPDAFVVGARLPVWGAAARHATQVARVRVGERIAVGDGRGRMAWGPVTAIGSNEIAITADEIVVAAPPVPRIRLIQALAKGDRDELAIQAATELGVDEVVPWQSARSVVKWDGPKAGKGVERWRAVVREAAKQSIRPTLPAVAEPVTSKALVDSVAERVEGATKRLTLILEPTARTSLAAVLRGPSVVQRPQAIALVVGPEGGIAPDELVQLEAAGGIPVRLGAEVLRTSTAGPAALAAIRALLGQW